MRQIMIGLMMVMGLSAGASAQTVHPFTLAQPEDRGSFYTLIEIPAGSAIKYEVDEHTGHVFVDRFLSMPVVYPANYGSLPSSLAGDGDPLDALVLTRHPILPGALVRARAVGVLYMTDAGDADDKIIAVPVSEVDPYYEGVRSIDDLPQSLRAEIEAFFRVYKDLPEGSGAVELRGYGDAAAAQALVEAALEAYRAN